MLVGKTLETILDVVVKMVNYIKNKLLISRLFAKPCQEMGANYANLLFHTEARWLSRGKALSQVYELKDELLSFFCTEKQEEFCGLFFNDNWISKLASLADTFGHLNNINSNMQSKNEIQLTK